MGVFGTAGAGIDLGPFTAAAEGIVGIRGKLDQMHEEMQTASRKPIYKDLGNSFIVPAGATGGIFSVSQQCPARGRVWNILKIIIIGPDGHTPLSPVTQQSTGSQTTPGAGTVITQVTELPAGYYTAQWNVSLGGTTGAAEANNFGLYSGATLVATSNNRTSTGASYPQLPVTFQVAANGTVSVQAIGAGTASSIYDASLVLTSGPAAVVDVYAGTEVDPNTPPSLDSLILSGGSGNVPSITWYSRGVEWCMSGEQVIAVVTGAQAGQVINVICRVAEYEAAAAEAMRA
jgi:hypothetical protein